jgi:septum formation protein
MEIILASASIRRQELLTRITENFQIRVSDFNEDSIEFKGNPDEYVKRLAAGKALDVCKRLQSDDHCIVIGCDTIVYHNGKVLGKPKDKSDACNMLELLSGGTHQVYSGIAVIDNRSQIVDTDFVCTEVVFSQLTPAQIKNYVETMEPMDKAGAYGIQGKAGVFVEKINGCYYNVVGLPLNRLYYMLKKMGVNL